MNVAMFGFGTPSLIFARSCKAKGLSVFLLEPAVGQTNWRRYSSCLSGASSIDPDLVGTPRGLAEVLEFVASVQARALLVNDEKLLAWLVRNRELFEPACVLLASSAASLNLLSDKQFQNTTAISAGFKVLPTWYVSSLEEAAAIPADSYPVCVRPSCPDSIEPLFKAEVLRSPGDLQAFLQTLSCIRAKLIAQPFISGPTLVVHGVRSPLGDFLSLRAFMAYRKHEGFTLALKDAPMHRQLKAACRRFAEISGLSGAFHYELIVSSKDGQAFFLEVNARLGGTTDKVMRLGFDEPGLLLKALGITLDSERLPYQPVSRRTIGKRLLIHNMLAAILDKTPAIDYPQTGRARQVLYSIWALMFLSDSVADWSDVRGTMWHLFYKKQHFRQTAEVLGEKPPVELINPLDTPAGTRVPQGAGDR